MGSANVLILLWRRCLSPQNSRLKNVILFAKAKAGLDFLPVSLQLKNCCNFWHKCKQDGVSGACQPFSSVKPPFALLRTSAAPRQFSR